VTAWFTKPPYLSKLNIFSALWQFEQLIFRVHFPHPVHGQSDGFVPRLHESWRNTSGVPYPRAQPVGVEPARTHRGTVCTLSDPGLFLSINILIFDVKSICYNSCRMGRGTWRVFWSVFLQDYVGAPCLRLEVMGCTRLECTDINECRVNNGGCDQKCVNG
jgi:hypothetical protein